MHSQHKETSSTSCTLSSNSPLKLPEYQLNYQSYFVDKTTEILLPSRYEPVTDKETGRICILGQGGYGIVIAAKDLQNDGNLVAIKKITDVFCVAPYRMLREIKILKHLQGHNNIVKLIDLYLPGNCLQEMNDLYIVLEMVNCGDLSRTMNTICKNVGSILIEDIKDIMCQILSAFYYLESAGIIHRDLKPENILVDLKENILVDLKENKEHLKLIINTLGNPEVSDVKGTPNAVKFLKNLTDKYQSTVEDFTTKFPNAPEEAIDLLKCFLTWNPEKRISFEQALNHPFLAGNKNINLLKHEKKIDLERVVINGKDILQTKYLFYKEILDWAENTNRKLDVNYF